MDIGKSYLVEVGNMTSKNNYVFISNVYGWIRVAHLFSFLCCPIMCLCVLNSVLWCPLLFRIKTMFGFSWPPVVCRRAYVLFTLFVVVCVKVVSNTYGVVLFGLVVFVLWIVYGGVQHIDVFCLLFCLSSLNLVLLWQLFYLFCSSIVINTVIVTAGTFEP
jgi:hypothetical protein